MPLGLVLGLPLLPLFVSLLDPFFVFPDFSISFFSSSVFRVFIMDGMIMTATATASAMATTATMGTGMSMANHTMGDSMQMCKMSVRLPDSLHADPTNHSRCTGTGTPLARVRLNTLLSTFTNNMKDHRLPGQIVAHHLAWHVRWLLHRSDLPRYQP